MLEKKYLPHEQFGGARTMAEMGRFEEDLPQRRRRRDSRRPASPQPSTTLKEGRIAAVAAKKPSKVLDDYDE